MEILVQKVAYQYVADAVIQNLFSVGRERQQTPRTPKSPKQEGNLFLMCKPFM